MRIFHFLLSACLLVGCKQQPKSETQTMCIATTVCTFAYSDSDSVYVGIINGTEGFIYVPWLLGADSFEHEISVDPVSYARKLQVQTNSPINDESGTTMLPPGGWNGIKLAKKDARELFQLSKGCQKLRVAYRVLSRARDKRLYEGSVGPVNIDVCL